MTNFYAISKLQIEPGTIQCSISFNANHEIFKGHFPNQPVVPGVCMLQIVKEVLERALLTSLRFTEAAQVKFLQLVTPDKVVEVAISYQRNEADIAVSAAFKGEAPVFKITSSYSVKS